MEKSETDDYQAKIREAVTQVLEQLCAKCLTGETKCDDILLSSLRADIDAATALVIFLTADYRDSGISNNTQMLEYFYENGKTRSIVSNS